MDETRRTDTHRRLPGCHAVNGSAAYLIRQPPLFTSLSPTVFALFRRPLRDASPRGVMIGRLVALAVGYGFLVLLELHEPNSGRKG